MRGPSAPAAALAAAFLLSACSPEAGPPAPDTAKTSPAGPSAAARPRVESAERTDKAPPAPGRDEDRIAAAKGLRRCGWLVNPTPGNWWLTDRDGQWILGTQGADQAPGMDEMPDMSTAGWVETNGHYGYGCACLTIEADGEGRVTRISNAEPKPLKQCRADRSLPKPD
jgi:hypothetical protein